MAGLLQLRVENYRSLRLVDVPLGRLNVLAGPNGSGKSNFLDVIRFLGDAARTDLKPALEQRGGLDRVLFRGASPNSFGITVRASVTKHSSHTAPDGYELTVGRRGSTPPRGSPVPSGGVPL